MRHGTVMKMDVMAHALYPLRYYFLTSVSFSSGFEGGVGSLYFVLSEPFTRGPPPPPTISHCNCSTEDLPTCFLKLKSVSLYMILRTILVRISDYR